MVRKEAEKAVDINEDFNIFKVLSTRENIDNPYPVYKMLRSYDPVFYMKSPTGFLSENIWILTRYDDISNVLINKKFGRGNRFGKVNVNSKFYHKLNSLTKMRQHWVTFLDPPEHTRIRNYINKAFSPKMVLNLKPTVISIANYLMDKFSSEVEFISEFSFPLAALSIAEIYGIPSEDRYILDKWAMQIVRTLDVVTNQFSESDLQNIYKCADDIKTYFGDIVNEKSNNPKDDLISKLITIKINDDKLTMDEIVSTLVLMIMDAHEAPKNLIANGLYALLNNPEQLEKLKNNPVLIDNAVEEFLRYDSPAQFTGRRSFEDEVIAGKQIKKGVQLICILGAGNRDPEKFVNPDMLDIERKKIIPLSFGGGIHHCAGAGLARIEAQTGINLLLERFSSIKLADKEYHYHNSLHSRGLESLMLNVKS